MKQPSSGASGKDPELFVRKNKEVDFSTFKPQLSAADIAKLTAQPGDIFPIGPIETLSAARTIGRGQTNLILLHPAVVETDANNPYASYESGSIQMYFDPGAYGIAYVASYVVEFNIVIHGNATFKRNGFAGSGNLPNIGTYTFNGPTTVQLVMQNVPSQPIYGALKHASGAPWDWYSSAMRFPYIVVNR